jgi:hypothetical protein
MGKKQTAAQKKDAQSAELEKKVDGDIAAAGNTVTEIDRATETTRPEDGLYTADGQPVLMDDDKPYTMQALNDLEEKAKGNAPADDGNPKLEELNKHVENLTNDLRQVYSDRDMWKQRAQDAENRVARFKEGLPRDSMGIPKVVD